MWRAGAGRTDADGRRPAAVIASAASKNKNSNSGSQYTTYFDRGCDAARNDRRDNRNMYYGRHSSQYDGRNEQAFASGYQ